MLWQEIWSDSWEALLTEPLLMELYRACLQAGAHPYVLMQPDAAGELLFAYGSDEQISYQSPIVQHEIETIDVTISLWGSENTKAALTIRARQTNA